MRPNIIPWPTDEEIADLANLEHASFKPANAFRDELIDYVKHGLRNNGYRLPWAKTHALFSMQGSITCIAGMSGHKKSFAAGMIVAWLIKDGVKCCIASLEMPAVITMDRMFRQAAGCEHGETWTNKMLDGPAQNLFIYDELDTVAPERMLAAVVHAAKNLDVKVMVIDSLTKCGIPPLDGASEKMFIDRLSQIAKLYKIHILLICHVRKPAQGGEEYIPGKHDIRGASEIGDLVDSIIVCHANKRREGIKATIAMGLPVPDKDMEYLEKSYDQVLNICKQRHGAFEGKIGLYFDAKSWQFVPDESGKVLPYHFGD